jgi:hypothetical protein
MCKRYVARLQEARDPKGKLRDRTALAYINTKIARPEMQTLRRWRSPCAGRRWPLCAYATSSST